MKTVLYYGILIIFIAFCGIASLSRNCSAAEDLTFTDADAKALKSDNPDAVAGVLYKLWFMLRCHLFNLL